MTTKATKEDVNYSLGMKERHCGQWDDKDKNFCAHFRDGLSPSCTKVYGVIQRRMWCRLFHKQGT